MTVPILVFRFLLDSNSDVSHHRAFGPSVSAKIIVGPCIINTLIRYTHFHLGAIQIIRSHYEWVPTIE